MTEPSKPHARSRRKRAPNGQGTLYERADGRWEGRLPVEPDGTGRRVRRSVYAPSRSQAAKALAEAIAERKAGHELADGRTTTGAYLDSWLERMRPPRVRPSTWRAYEWSCRALIKPRIGATPIGRLSGGLVSSMLEDVAAVHGGRSAVNAHAVLRKALSDAVRARVVPRNVAKDVSAPDHSRSVPMPWDISEGARFLELIRGERDEALYTVALLVGLRQGELLGLRWDHVDLERGYLTVAATLTWVDGRPYLGPPKSEAGARTVGLKARTIAALTAWRARQDLEREATPSEWWANGLVFATRDGQPRRGTTLDRQFTALCERVGMPRVRFHDLRRWFATATLTATNGNVHAAGASMGHSRKSNLALDVYGALTPEVAKMVAESVEGLLESTASAGSGHTADAPRKARLSSEWSSDQLLSKPEATNRAQTPT